MPVGRGRTEVGVLVGGPLTDSLGFVAPVPEHRVHARGGLTDDLDLDGSIALAPLTSSVLALDVGFVAQIVRLPRFAASGSIRLNCVYDLDDGFADTYYPELGLHLQQRFERWLALITGFSALVQPSPGSTQLENGLVERAKKKVGEATTGSPSTPRRPSSPPRRATTMRCPAGQPPSGGWMTTPSCLRTCVSLAKVMGQTLGQWVKPKPSAMTLPR